MDILRQLSYLINSRLLIVQAAMAFTHAQETVAIKSCSGCSFKVTQQDLRVAMYLVF